MLKLGIFGDQSTNPELLAQLGSLPGTNVSGVFYSGNTSLPNPFPELSSPESLMDISDALLILSDKSVSSDLIRMILRKSKHLYLKTIPNMNIREVKELIDLEKEAGIITYIYNPFNYIPWLDPYQTNYEKPMLLNLRTCFEGTLLKPAQELLLLVTALNRLAQSNFKKIDVFGLENQSVLVVSLRIEYDNGSVFNLTLSQEPCSGFCEIIEQSSQHFYTIDQPLFVQFPQLNQENTAIAGFIQSVREPALQSNTFDNFLGGLQILQEIKTQLRFNEIVF